MSEATAHKTPARRLFLSALHRLSEALALQEVAGEDGSPHHMILTSHAPFHQGPCGEARMFTGKGIHRIVAVSITVPAIGLDSHMIFAFTPASSGVPHFTVDSVQAGEHMAFHLDLIPRLDLAVNLAYMDWAYGGLTETFTASTAIEGLTAAQITPRQRAVMSPWMIVNRATPEAFSHVEPLVLTYLNHWLGLLDAGTPDALGTATDGQILAQRDKANRAVIFDPDVDKVWNQIRGLIGHDAVEAIRALLLDTGA